MMTCRYYDTDRIEQYIEFLDSVDIDHCENMIESIIESIYKTGDIERLEDSLDELALSFKIRIPRTSPILEKKGVNMKSKTVGKI